MGDPASLMTVAPRPLSETTGPLPSPDPRPRPDGVGEGAFGLRAMPWTQSKSERDESGFTRPSGVTCVLVKM